MCGITGLWSLRSSERALLDERVAAMNGTIVHRGPDDSGIFCDKENGVALGFRRLAIVDLSEQGHQPMHSASGRFTIVFNGEVYNHNQLRAELQQRGFHFRGHSDTEVMLAAFEHWGIESALQRFNGMFAFALWDARERSLTLARDRIGKKPLFIYRRNDLLLFGSELKTLAAHPHFERRIDPASVSAYLRYMYVPAPHSIFEGVEKLLPAHYVTFTADTLSSAQPRAFWRVEDLEVAGRSQRATHTSDAHAIEHLHELLRDSVRLRMQSDVPFGALLSGGIDSSAVVGVMQELSDRPILTFTIGFDVPDYDEAVHARRVAQHLGTDHTEMYVDGKAALDVVPLLPRMFDEPLADPSQIPTYLVCALARQSVTVALTGDGGDELFAGYHRYLQGERLIRQAMSVPPAARNLAAAMLQSVPGGAWRAAERAFPGRAPRLLTDKVRKTALLLREQSPGDMYRSLQSMWQRPSDLLAAAVQEPRGATVDNGAGYDLLRAMQLVDQRSYLPDDLLAKVDRASMAVSLEARVPLLDYRIIEYSWTLPRDLLVRDGVGKWILRQILYRYVPREVVDRPKMGFSVPIADWLAGPLRTAAGDLLTSSAGSDGVLNSAAVAREWNRFVRGDRSNALGIWTLYMFHAWRNEWLSSSPAAANH